MADANIRKGPSDLPIGTDVYLQKQDSLFVSDDVRYPITPYVIRIVEITSKCYPQVSEAPRTIEMCDAVLRITALVKSLDIAVAAQSDVLQQNTP